MGKHKTNIEKLKELEKPAPKKKKDDESKGNSK
jgi:hypothetical protein